jgi:hypothetical protein
MSLDQNAGQFATAAQQSGRRQHDDEAYLWIMASFNAKLITAGKAPSDRAAADYVLQCAGERHPPWNKPAGASDTAITTRLRRKYRQRRDELIAVVMARG